jgi:hypothetical protein
LTTEQAERPGAGRTAAGAPRWLERSPLLWALGGLTLCAAALAAGARLLHGHRLGRPEALFIGLPVALALLALVRAARSPVWGVIKAALLVLCLLAPLGAESALWLVAGAPFVLGLAALLSLAVYGRR